MVFYFKKVYFNNSKSDFRRHGEGGWGLIIQDLWLLPFVHSSKVSKGSYGKLFLGKQGNKNNTQPEITPSKKKIKKTACKNQDNIIQLY